MDSVGSMKLSRIIKNRKAMTPLMIGVIVAASVVAVFFVIMAATVPLYKKEVYVSVREGSIQANSTDNKALSFKVICDYDDGYLRRLEIVRGNERIGYREVNYLLIKNYEKFITLEYFYAIVGVTPADQIEDGTNHLLFLDDDTYILRIFYEDVNGNEFDSQDYEFTYD